MLYDAHAHLDLMDEEELALALIKAKDARVGQIISCSTSFSSNEKNILLAEKYEQIKAAIGLYPLDTIDLTKIEIDKAFDFFNAQINNPKVIAIGEIGLDYKYSTKETEQEKQRDILTRFVGLSKEHKKPLIIHSRFAQRQVLEELEKQNAKKVLLHSFVDSKKLMARAADNGYFISVGLSVLENEEVQKNLKQFPPEHLLFETDSPIRFFGEKAYPEKIAQIMQKVAKIKEMPQNEIEKQQEKNFKKLF